VTAFKAAKEIYDLSHSDAGDKLSHLAQKGLKKLGAKKGTDKAKYFKNVDAFASEFILNLKQTNFNEAFDFDMTTTFENAMNEVLGKDKKAAP
jgi:hypothetical protein